ncbi:MAG: T9SS type A sorting domain-containing protein, partial [Chitinophagaceae bacterium]|nr:T9SS type A sorting domain-containing protein [Chitinophagaceae bacterium]
PQHVTNINMKFDEEVFGFNISSLKLTRNGEVFPLGIAQLSNTDLKTWMAGNFGLITYPDGNYIFTITTSGFTDALGNPGTETKQLSWTVNHSLIVGITNLSISPDKGYSATDKVTSGQTINLSFNLAAAASQVTISQTDLSGENVLAILSNVSAGTVNLPLTLPIGGNVGLKITAVGALGGTGIAIIDFFVDQVALGGKWMVDDNRQIITQVDTIPFIFSTRLLKDTAVLKSLKLLKNGVAVPTTGMDFSKVNDTLYKFYGIRSVDTTAGSYTFSVNLEKLHKYTSGLNGLTMIGTSWTVLSNNKPPQANAGNDTTITKTGIVKLSGLLSFDPEAAPLTYRWIAPQGIKLSDSTSATPTFPITEANQGKTYKFLLIVSDGSLITTAVVNVVVALSEVLPLTLLDFVAVRSGNNVALDWKTAHEINVNKFSVEWSSDGRSWSSVGNVGANNRLENSYHFIHNKPVTGDNFYRLRMIDHDGHAVLSAIRKVQFTQGNLGLVLIPNPSNSYAILTIPSGLNTRVIQIYGASGNMVRQFTLDNGINQLRINTAGLAAGMYTIHAGKYVVRMLVQH